MKIIKVVYNNIDSLYEAIAIGKLNKSGYSDKLGDHINSILLHSSISLFIDDASLFESYILKRFTNSNNFIITNSLYDNEALGDKYTPTIDNILTISNSIDNDDDIKFKVDQYFITTGCISKQVVINICGTSLYSIFGAMPDIFFMQTFDFKENSDFTPSIPDFNKLEESIITSFMNNYYNYLQSSVNAIDLVTDSYINNNYYRYIDSEDKTSVTLTDVVCPNGSISFIGEKSKNVTQGLNDISSYFNFVSNSESLIQPLDPQYISTDLYFVINCSFYAFLEMFLYLPNNFFIDNQDLKTLFIDNAKMIIPEGLSKYAMRLSSKISELKKVINEVSSKKENNLTRYNFIPLNTSIKFSLKVSLNDISSILLKYNKFVIDGNYGKDSSISNEIYYIINNIMKNSKTIYSLIEKNNKK